MPARHRKRSGSFLIVIVALLGLVGVALAIYASVTGSRPGDTRVAASGPSRAQPSTPSLTTPRTGSPQPPSPTATPQHPKGASATGPLMPPIVWKPIPFGPSRQKETVTYVKRHYGLDTWHLRHPHVIVEHYTAGSSFQSAYNTFAANAPDLGELPGTCTHFVVDTDGTIYQLVPLSTICRHTVGLNDTAIGIEHVGTSDQQILRDKPQFEASLRLTLWLMQRYRISLPNVIGHSESLSSPYHRENVAPWRCQTHADWTSADMNMYRRDLVRLAHEEAVHISESPSPGRSDATSC